MHSHGQVSKLWKTLKQAKLKLSPPNKPRSSKSTLKTPGKLSTLNTAPTYLKKHLETTHGNTQRTSQEINLQTPLNYKQKSLWMNQMVLKIETGYISQYLTTVHLTNVLIRTLSNNKSPGPDDIVNELLRMLPTERTPYTCSSLLCGQLASHQKLGWEISNTILIDKNKGDETDASSYHQIGLANTLYKLWTRLITNTLYKYAEANSILSTTQAGFRKQKDPIHQLETGLWH